MSQSFFETDCFKPFSPSNRMGFSQPSLRRPKEKKPVRKAMPPRLADQGNDVQDEIVGIFWDFRNVPPQTKTDWKVSFGMICPSKINPHPIETI